MSDESKESIQVELRYIRRDLDDIKSKLNNHYVTTEEFLPIKNHFISREEFAPVKNIVYGMVTLILIAVTGAFVTLIIK